jgi:type I restriction enzyme M protein
MSDISAEKRKLEQKLWAVADLLRGKMHAEEFRDYMLGFIFFKYLSEKTIQEAKEFFNDDSLVYQNLTPAHPDYEDAVEAFMRPNRETLGFSLRPEYLFSNLARRGREGEHILDDLKAALLSIETSAAGTASEDDFKNLFEDLELNSSKLGNNEKKKNALIASVLSEIEEVDFSLALEHTDFLGDAYEYLIGQFAAGAGKKAGEFYTPQSVSTILARIVSSGKTRLKSVYDPTCGSGSLLLRVGRYVGADNVTKFYGQELNRTTYNLARMNMIMHGVRFNKFDIRQDDTLEDPHHRGIKMEAIVANPPFSINWSARAEFLDDERFSPYGRLAPKTKADYAFVTHMYNQLDEGGTMAVVLPHGVLFRGAAEGVIREYLIKEENALDAVIGLPANIFFGTTIPTCILVFKKCRENEDVLFVDASTFFSAGKNQNLLEEAHQDQIFSYFLHRKDQKGFSRLVNLSEISDNDFNLNISRYIDSFTEDEKIDIEDVMKDLKSIEGDIKNLDINISKMMSNLTKNENF